MNVRELIADVKSKIIEIDANDIEYDSVTFIDVREPNEHETGIIPGSLTIARGVLETTIENRIPDRDQALIVYCASGIRSAFATNTLGLLGYTNVKSLIGGFNKWKDDGRAIEIPNSMSSEQLSRYHRHLLLPEVGEDGQHKLFDAKVLLLGAGGLGAPAALYLAAAGIGTLGVIDMDVVDSSNLQRQVIHSINNIGMLKTESTKARILSLNPDCNVITFNERLNAENVIGIISQFDIVLDGTDNFPTRYLLNDASVLTGIPVVHGSIFRFEGQVAVLDPKNGPCYRCMLPEPPPPELAPSCAEAGVLGILPGIVGSLQTLETIKYILGIGDLLVGKLLAFDSLEESFRTFTVKKNPDCPTCGPNAHPTIKEYDQYCQI